MGRPAGEVAIAASWLVIYWSVHFILQPVAAAAQRLRQLFFDPDPEWNAYNRPDGCYCYCDGCDLAYSQTCAPHDYATSYRMPCPFNQLG